MPAIPDFCLECNKHYAVYLTLFLKNKKIKNCIVTDLQDSQVCVMMCVEAVKSILGELSFC